MFVKLQTDQISAHWDKIDRTIKESLNPSLSDLMTGLVRDIMLENAQVWFYQEAAETLAVFITRLTKDYAVGRSTLTIIASYGFAELSDKVFIEGYKTAYKYAKGTGCTHMDFYTDNPQIKKYAEMFNPSWRCEYFQIKL